MTYLADCVVQQESWQQDAVVMGGFVAIVALLVGGAMWMASR